MSGMTQHLDYDVLADLAEGLLDAETAASVQAHLELCDECRTRVDDLTRVTRLLAAAPLPAMPAGLAERLDAAILSEAAHAPVTPLASRRRARVFQALSAAAAVVVASGVGVAAVRTLDSASSSDTNAAATAPRPAAADAGEAKAAETVPPVASGTRYQRSTLGSQLAARLRAATDAPGRVITAPVTLQGCVDRATGGRPVVFVDTARYEGSPATIIVLDGSAARHEVVVVGPDCSASDADVQARLTVTLD